MSEEKRKVILSGIQPTGNLHMGNYAGAIINWVSMQEEYECYFTIVDQHSITIRQKAADLRKNTYEMAAMLLACGISPEKSVLFVQSHVPAHAQLAWVLYCNTQLGELNRMTQFKDKSKKHPENINAGLFTYPALQAADILLYQADMVPVGEDQKQHLELTRDIADRFNSFYSPTFTMPEPYIPKLGARIMSLQDPTKKMSKSDENEKATLFLTDPDNVIKNKIKRAVTDSGSDIKHSVDKPGISNLMSLYSMAKNISFAEIEEEFDGAGYGDFKAAVANAVADYLAPIRERFLEIKENKKYLVDVLKAGADSANRTANKTLRKVYKKIGFIQI
jgi:tryptophanyl-tRNA synthetase